MPEEATTEATKPALEPQNFSLPIHGWIESAQTSHGVRHDDYAQYHAYCSRRLSRLRHHPDVKKDLVHSSKYSSSGSKGKPRHAYCPRDDTAGMEIVPHINYLWTVLVSAERSWAQACELKKIQGKKQHVLRRLRKAYQFAIRLMELAKVNCDPVTQKESEAYAGWIHGNWALEKADYEV